MKQPVFYTGSLAIGDCICGTPTIRKLSEVYASRVIVYSHFPEIFSRLPYVSSSFDLKTITSENFEEIKKKNDVHFSFLKIGQKVKMSDERGVEFKHAMIDIRQYHALDSGFMLKKSELQCDFIPELTRQIDLPDTYVCLHPFKNWPSRTWDSNNWNILVKLLLESNIPVVIIGKDKVNESMIKYLKDAGFDDRVFKELEEKKTDKVNVAGVLDLTNSTTISEAWEVINKASCVVTMDSGILHLAGTTDTHIVQLGSSIDPEFRAPYRNGRQDYKYHYIAGGCDIFCASNLKYSLRDWENGCSGGTPLQCVTLIDTCLEKKKTFECHPTPEKVFHKAKEIFDNILDREWKIGAQKFITELNAPEEIISTKTLSERHKIDAVEEITKMLKQELATSDLIKIQSGALGDMIGALTVIDAYSKGEPIGVISKLGRANFGVSYPNITWHPHDSEPEYDIKTGTYQLNGTFYKNFKRIYYRFEQPLIKGYAEQLDITEWETPSIDIKVGERPIKGKYVCFSMHSTIQCKHWNYPNGWDILCKLLRKEGLTPVCIDRFEKYGQEGQWNEVPSSCVKRQSLALEDMTTYLDHAEFFIGISSGLAWVAHAVGTPVVLISGVTAKDNEFEENTLRIINENVCHGCINEPDKYKFDTGDWMWCPVHKGTAKQFECTTTITPEYVFEEIKKWRKL